jgi:drug/metabolite transporter (DMT)-like permease
MRRTWPGLVLVMLLWAACFPLITVGLGMAPPLTFAALRALVAGVSLLVLAVVLRRPLPRSRHLWLSLLGVGVTTTSLGFAGMFLVGGRVSPGLATVIANAQPLIAAVLAYFFLAERLGRPQRLGLAMGFAGILVVAAPGFNQASESASPSGVAYVLAGALGVAIGNVLLKRLAGQTDLLLAMGGQFVLGSVPLGLLAAWLEAPVRLVWTPQFVVVLLTLGLLGTALAYGLWFALLVHAELTRLNTFTFLTPAFALVIGGLFFGERLQWMEVAGMVLILAGVWWVSQPGDGNKAPVNSTSPGFQTDSFC